MADCGSLTHASTPAPARGSLQRELDEQLDRHTRLMKLAEHNGFEITIHELEGRPFWLVPRQFVPIVGCMAAAVRLP